jgi:hypothetical protein
LSKEDSKRSGILSILAEALTARWMLNYSAAVDYGPNAAACRHFWLLRRGSNSTIRSMTRTHFIGWFAEFAASSLERVPDKPIMKVSVLIAVCAFSMWTMLPFSSDAKPWYNGS